MIVYYCGFRGTYGVGEVGESLYLYLFDRSEAEEQVAGGFLADARDVGERGAEGSLGTFVAVESDGKAVDLILYLLKEVEEWVSGFELDNSRRKAIEEFVGAVAVVFGEAGNGNFEVQFVV